MKPVVFVIQRFGAEVAGGAEAHCRKIALRLAETQAVEVWTTTALDYRTWQDHYPAGESCDGNVLVRRFAVTGQRTADFDQHTARLLALPDPSEAQQLAWLEAQGPASPDLLEFVQAHAAEAQAIFFYTYLYWPTYQGLLAAPSHAILIPTLHDEPVAHFSIFKRLLSAPKAILFLTPEEQEFASSAFSIAKIPARILGTALDQPLPRSANASPNSRYILYLGRVDAGKGAAELAHWFGRFLEAQSVRFPDTELWFCGQLLMQPVVHPRIRYLGFQSEEAVAKLLQEATIVVTPGPFESLSLTALEAMACGVPVLVNGKSKVLAGHCQRSGGGLAYEAFEEFEEALSLLLASDRLRRCMGQCGARYVQRHYSWPAVLDTMDWAVQQAKKEKG